MKLVSPVFTKEMVTLARRKRHFFARGLLLSVLLACIAMSWHSDSSLLEYQGFMDTSFLGRQLFVTFSVTQLLAVVILVPALTAPTIAAEKDRNTLSLLLMSNLNKRNILLDKLLSRLCLIMLLLLCGLPLFLALLAFGGITPGQIITSYTAILATILFCSGVGLFFSTVLNKMHTALIATYAVLAGYFFGVILLKEIDVLPLDTDNFLPVDFSYSFSFPDETILFLLLSALVFTISFAICHHILPRMVGAKKRHAVKRLFDRLNAFFNRINFTGVVVMDENRALKRNAVLWKESHKRFFSSNTFLIRASYMLIIISMIAFVAIRDWDIITGVMMVIGAILLGIIAIVSSSTAFTSEREQHSFDVILSSPITARAIVMAKFVGILRLTLPILACMTIWLVISTLAGVNYYSGGMWRRIGSSFSLLLIAGCHIPMLVVIGLYASAKRKRTSSAVLQTFLICLVWSLLPLLLFVLSPEASAMYSYIGLPWFTDTGWWLLSMAPVTAVFMAFKDAFSAWACLFLIPCWLILLRTLVGRFDRLVGRQ